MPVKPRATASRSLAPDSPTLGRGLRLHEKAGERIAKKINHVSNRSRRLRFRRYYMYYTYRFLHVSAHRNVHMLRACYNRSPHNENMDVSHTDRFQRQMILRRRAMEIFSFPCPFPSGPESQSILPLVLAV
jgi:hypothetical protein